MKPIIIVATILVHIALIAYSVAIITEQRKHRVTPIVLWVLTCGVVFDIAATACMIAGSTKSPFSLHGILGYSSLSLMLIDAVLIWRFHRHTPAATVPGPLHLYSRIAYIWWLLAYLTGSTLVMLRQTGA